MNYTFYRIEFPSGQFYIGSTTSDNVEKYFRKKFKDLSKRNNFSYVFDDLKIITKTDFNSEEELRNFEKQEIKKYIRKDPLCLNRHLQTNCQKEIAQDNICKECKGKNGLHKRNCSKVKKCFECGGINNSHKKGCSKRKELPVCSECKGKDGKHFKFCSHYIKQTPCLECGARNGHLKSCSKYKESKKCPECGSIRGHKHNCSYYRKIDKCLECGGIEGHHTKNCSMSKKCPICQMTHGHHKPNCPNLKKCQYCGGVRGKHEKDCPNCKTCSECKGINGNHFKTCSKYKRRECPECGGKNGLHKDSCPKSLGKCKYCGYSLQSHKHAKDCPNYKPRKKKEEVK